MRKIAVTGATGAIGMALIKRAITNSTKVVVFIRKESARGDRIPDNELITKVFCGLNEMNNIEVNDDLKDCDAFYHFAWEGTSGASRNDLYMQNRNVKHALDAVRLASKMGCRVFVGAGSQAEYGRVAGILQPDTPCNPENGYGIAKLCAGHMTRLLCEEEGLSHIWTRILSVYGPYDNERSMMISTIRTLLAGDRPLLTKGEQQWDFLYSEDAADIMYMLAQKAVDEWPDVRVSRLYCVGNGKALPLRDYIDIIKNEIDPTANLGYGEIPYSDKQVMHLEADISSIVDDIGYTPKTDFLTGAKKTIDWCRENCQGNR